MPDFKIIDSRSDINLNNNWVSSTKFHSKDRLVSDNNGRQYRIIEKMERSFSISERIQKVFLGISAVVCTLSLALYLKPIRNLFTKTKENIRFAVKENKIQEDISNQSKINSYRINNPTSYQGNYNNLLLKKDFGEISQELRIRYDRISKILKHCPQEIIDIILSQLNGSEILIIREFTNDEHVQASINKYFIWHMNHNKSANQLGLNERQLSLLLSRAGRGLRKLNLENLSIKEPIKLIQFCPELNFLSLNGENFNKTTCLEVLEELKLQKKLSSLKLHKFCINTEGVKELAALTNLKSLDLRNSKIGDEGAKALATLINLTSLALWNNEIGNQGAIALAALTNLTLLDLGFNGIGNQGAIALAALTNLTLLDLGFNGIGDEGARALAALTKLTLLDLGNNRIGAKGAKALAALTNLTSLALWLNHIGDEGAKALAALINLTLLDLGFNGIGDEGAKALATLINLTSLDLGNNRIGDEGARALAALTKLTSLALEFNGIGDEGAKELKTALSKLQNFNF